MKLKFFFCAGGFFLFFGVLSGILPQMVLPIEPSFLEGKTDGLQRERSEEEFLRPGPTPMEIPAEAIGHMDLYILGGQSNMVGYGEIHPEDAEIDPRVLVFGNDYRWRLAREPIDDPTGQVDLVSIDIGAGFSCGTTFAKTLLSYNPSAYIGLIPCAKSGSSIAEWQRNLNENSLYGSCLKRTLAASPMGRIRGLLFFQGETDALDPDLEPQKIKSPSQWGKKFSKFVRDIRSDLKIYDLPIVFAQIGGNKNSKEFKNWGIVQKEQGKVRLPNCRMIKTDDLSLKDTLHFDRRSYRIIGERFGKGIIEMMPKAGDKLSR